MSLDTQPIGDAFIQPARPRPLDCLTPRELEVAKLIASGMEHEEIADHIGVSLATVHTHRANLLRKLELFQFGTAANVRLLLLMIEQGAVRL